MEDKFYQQLKALGIKLSDNQKSQFERYYKLLDEWNQVMNLTSIIRREEVFEKHFIDSLSLVKAVNVEGCSSLADIGTGAGFPGLPVKIVFPSLKIVLIDSLDKRIRFLNAVIEETGLEGVTALHGRAEDFARLPSYRQCFDLCVSRAVARLPVLCEYCLPYVKIGGMFIAFKSERIDEEVAGAQKAINVLGGEIKECVKIKLPGSDIRRALVKVEKVRSTAGKYPRKAGMPLKKPIT